MDDGEAIELASRDAVPNYELVSVAETVYNP